MPTADPTLAERMRAYVEQHPECAEKFAPHIKALEEITYEMPAPKILGRWARARRAWCDETGEPLV